MASSEAIDKIKGNLKALARAFPDKGDEQMAKVVVDQEYMVGRNNTQIKGNDLQAAIDMLECVRTVSPKESWQSNVMIPEFASIQITLAGNQASQYFQRRDFVECHLQDDSEEALRAKEAAQLCINKTLNMRHLHYYIKFMRAIQLATIGGEVFL